MTARRGRTGRRLLATALAVSVFGCMSCQYVKEHETAQGALVGTAAGAALGAVVGEATKGEAGKGALIGGVIGGAVGTGVGYYLAQRKNRLEQIPNTTVVQEPYTDPVQPGARPVQTLSVTLNSQVLFAYDSDALLPGARESLNQIAAVLTDPQYPPPRRIIVTGHTDSVGDRQYNLDLSKRRADTVMRYLISQGVDPSRIVATGMGPDDPVASNATPEGRAMNRRVEIRIIPGD